MAYNLSEAGNYIMTTKFHGTAIMKGRLRIFVEPAPVFAPACIATGDGIADTTAGSPTFFLLQLRDKYSNDQVGKAHTDHNVITPTQCDTVEVG